MILPRSHVKIVIFSIIAIAVICSSMAIANIAHAGKTELPVVLSHDVRLVLSPTINPQQKSNTVINIFTLLQQYQNKMANVFQSDDCINDKIDCSVKSHYYLIINHCTGLNWSDWRFKRSLKLLFTDDQLHTSLTDEILMKN